MRALQNSLLSAVSNMNVERSRLPDNNRLETPSPVVDRQFITPSPIESNNGLSVTSSPNHFVNSSDIGKSKFGNVQKYPEISAFESFDVFEMEEVLDRIKKENEFVEEEAMIFEAYLKKTEKSAYTPTTDSTSNLPPKDFTRSQSRNQLVPNNKLASVDVSLKSSSSTDNAIRRKSVDNISNSSYDEGSDDASSVGSSGASTIQQQQQKKKKKRRQQVQEYQLTYENKIEIAKKAIDILRSKVEKKNKNFEKEVESINARIEESVQEIKEIDKEIAEFRKTVVEPSRAKSEEFSLSMNETPIGGQNTSGFSENSMTFNPASCKLLAEKFYQYFKYSEQQKDTLIHSLTLKISETKKQVKKLKQQLESREQSGDQLTKTDFDQLKIENKQNTELIKERNSEAVDLKASTGVLLQKLGALTEKLNKFTQASRYYRKEIERNKKELDRLKKEIEEVLKVKESETGKNKELVNQHERIKVPDILTYVKLKAELDLMRKEVDNWNRKVEIQTMNEVQTRKQLQQLLQQ
ncbi:hypothetical protein ABK040_009505 [Willaertia magna]